MSDLIKRLMPFIANYTRYSADDLNRVEVSSNTPDEALHIKQTLIHLILQQDAAVVELPSYSHMKKIFGVANHTLLNALREVERTGYQTIVTGEHAPVLLKDTLALKAAS